MSKAETAIQIFFFLVFVIAAIVLMKFVRPEDMVKVKILIDFGQLMASFAPTVRAAGGGGSAPFAFPDANRFCMALLCGRARRLHTENPGFRPGQFEIQWPKVSVKYFEFFKLFNFDITALMRTWGCANPIFATFYVKVRHTLSV
jgi:hypothetical protein